MKFNGKTREANLRILLNQFGQGEIDKWSNATDNKEEKKVQLISPFQKDAFTEPVIHKVVLSQIDFELSEKIWESINAGFAHYWDIEVGYGNYPDFYSACSSIDNHLKKERIIFSFDRLVTIVNIMFDFIEKIPGVFLDETDEVTPRKDFKLSFKYNEQFKQ